MRLKRLNTFQRLNTIRNEYVKTTEYVYVG